MENNSQDGSGVSHFKAAVTFAVGLLLIAFVLIFLKCCTLSEKNEEKDVQKSESMVVLVDESNSNYNEENSLNESDSLIETEKSSIESLSETVGNGSNSSSENNLESIGNNLQTDISSESSETEVESSSESDIGYSDEESGYKEIVGVEEPVLGEIYDISAIVSGKSVYSIDNESYAYTLNIIIPAGDEYKVINHFCSKKIYDGVNTGETIQVSLQFSEEGLISILTITK